VGRLHWAAFLLVNTNPKDTVRVAERVRGLIEHVAFADAARTIHRITLSVGGASFPQDGANHRLLLERAEVNLREAVRRGGNQIVGPDDAGIGKQ
jgi:diguanylate cyclase (GGDEF)-like protein